MLAFDDPIWSGLRGAHGTPYDPRPALARLEAGPDEAGAWDELWEELHHQGDLGEAAYAAVCALAQLEPGGADRWNRYALAACIEMERHRRGNPPVPARLRADYAESLERLGAAALDELREVGDPLLFRSALGLVARSRGEVELGALLSTIDDDDVAGYLEERLAWSDLYAIPPEDP